MRILKAGRCLPSGASAAVGSVQHYDHSGFVRKVTTPLDMPLLEELSIHMYDVTDFIPLSNAALPRLKSLEFQNAHGPLYASGFGIR